MVTKIDIIESTRLDVQSQRAVAVEKIADLTDEIAGTGLGKKLAKWRDTLAKCDVLLAALPAAEKGANPQPGAILGGAADREAAEEALGDVPAGLRRTA